MAERELTNEEAHALGLTIRELSDAEAAKLGLETQAAPGEGPGRLEALARGATQGATFGFGDELWGGARAIGESLPTWLGGEEARPGQSLGDAFLGSYRKNRDQVRAGNDAAEKAHGGYYLGGNLLGGLATVPLTAGGTEAKGLWELAKAGAKVGGLMGAAGGAGSSKADLTQGDVGGVAKDAAVGGVVGGVLGGALPVIGAGASAGGKFLNAVRKGGYVVPTPEAERLAQEGVDLTLGQMNPDSLFGRMEELTAKKAHGGIVDASRARSAASVRDALLRRAGAPGAPAPTAGADVAAQLEELGAGYGSLYDKALAGERLSPEGYLGKGRWRGLLTDENLVGSAKAKGAFNLATDNPNIIASPDDRALVGNWLEQQAKSLPKTAQSGGDVDATALQTLRSEIRNQARSFGGPNASASDRSKAQMLHDAEGFVTELLNGQLSPEKAAALQGADSKYRDLLAVKDAASRAFVQNQEFTPGQLLMSIRKRGATPEMESLARDAHAVLGATYPPTGLQGAAMDVAPGAKWLAPAWTTFANSNPTLKAHALGQGALPGFVRAPVRLGEGLLKGIGALSDTELKQMALIRALQSAEQ